jgi:hypothetical protein
MLMDDYLLPNITVLVKKLSILTMYSSKGEFMSGEGFSEKTESIPPGIGYGPILRPSAREAYSLRQQIFEQVRANS